MAIIDCVTFNGENEIFNLRYNILKDVVDQFIVIESDTTFSGHKKPLYFKDILDKYEKVKYFVIDRNWTENEIKLANESPCTEKGDPNWTEEFLQKESIKKALTHLNDDDIVFIGDSDEIWDKSALEILGKKLKLRVYTYWLNNASDESFAGGLLLKYKDIKGVCLNEIRNFTNWTDEYYGWHFTSMAFMMERKLRDGYTSNTYAHPVIMENLEYNITNNLDFLGRKFHYKTDEDNWPQYLKDNRELYAHLCK